MRSYTPSPTQAMMNSLPSTSTEAGDGTIGNNNNRDDSKNNNQHDDHDNTKGKRRRTRGFIACDACQRRKSRCEMLDERGCHRCRVLQTPCSLVGQVGTLASGSNHMTKTGALTASEGSDPGHASPGTSQVPEAWMNRMERMLERVLDEAEHRRTIRDSPSTSTTYTTDAASSTGSLRPDGIGPYNMVFDEEPAVRELLQGTVGTSLLVSTGLNIHDRTIFRDPLHEWVLSAAEMNVAYTSFLSQMNNLVPVHRLYPTIDKLTNPFLRSCILDYYLASQQQAQENTMRVHSNRAILRHNLECLWSCNPSTDIMLGLFTLSMKPLDSSSTRFARHMDGKGYIGRATSMAAAFGLDDIPARACKDTTERLMGVGSETMLHRSLLWHTLAHRSAWVDIFSSPSFTTRPFAVPPPSAVYPHQLGTSEPLITHLLLEERLFNLVGTVSAAMQRVRNESFEASRLNLAEYAIRDFGQQVAAWRQVVASAGLPSASWLALQSYHLEMLIPFKFTTDLRVLIPSPIQHDHITNVFDRLVLTFLPNTRKAIKHAAQNRMNAGTFPAFGLTLALIPYHTNAVVARMHDDHSYTTSPEGMWYRQMLLNSHPAAPLLVGHLDCTTYHAGWKQKDVDALTDRAFDDFPPLLVDELLSWIQSDFADTQNA